MTALWDGLLILCLTIVGSTLLIATLNRLEDEWPAVRRSYRKWRQRRADTKDVQRAIDKLIRETQARERV